MTRNKKFPVYNAEFLSGSDLDEIAQIVMRSRTDFANRGTDKRFVELDELGYTRSPQIFIQGKPINYHTWNLLPLGKYEAFFDLKVVGDFAGRITFRKVQA